MKEKIAVNSPNNSMVLTLSLISCFSRVSALDKTNKVLFKCLISDSRIFIQLLFLNNFSDIQMHHTLATF